MTDKKAIMDEIGVYRYSLTREWTPTIFSPYAEIMRCVFIGLNPSTADAEKDDPTIRRCIGFARRFGCSSLEMVNLFAYRATNPRELQSSRLRKNVYGPENSRHIIEAARRGIYIIAAWGRPRWDFVRATAETVIKMLELRKIFLHCLGKTSEGFPRHPLYLPKDAKLEIL